LRPYNITSRQECVFVSGWAILGFRFGSARPTFDRQDDNFAKRVVDTIGTEDLLITTNGGF